MLKQLWIYDYDAKPGEDILIMHILHMVCF